ncbi:MIZ/SP-RING zinc finger domain-containing protein [Ditylenchus destructor]|uniref:MIZ/SP-RING zinc finger domain-containing protein n=1 Tax=Ditylenchus destructor TaxID=166010 RepID=A0AAD4QVV2_9BILA|nr:MIZ/SP-RING zinc finger domain-containing protein [Ditylenchus destructor]
MKPSFAFIEFPHHDADTTVCVHVPQGMLLKRWQMEYSKLISNQNRRIPLETVKTAIRSASEDGMFEQWRITLKCPLYGQRIKVPARYADCVHIECFDLEAFLRMKTQKNLLVCPICQKEVKKPLTNLRIDTYIETVLSTLPHAMQVELLSDGSFTEVFEEFVVVPNVINDEGPFVQDEHAPSFDVKQEVLEDADEFITLSNSEDGSLEEIAIDDAVLATNETLQQELDESKAELDASKAEVEAAQARVKDLEESILELERKYQVSESQLRQTSERNRQLTERNRSLEQEMTNSHAKNRDLETKLVINAAIPQIARQKFTPEQWANMKEVENFHGTIDSFKHKKRLELRKEAMTVEERDAFEASMRAKDKERYERKRQLRKELGNGPAQITVNGIQPPAAGLSSKRQNEQHGSNGDSAKKARIDMQRKPKEDDAKKSANVASVNLSEWQFDFNFIRLCHRLPMDRLICSICREALDNGKGVCCLPCGHVTHIDCLNRWAKEKLNCPNCWQHFKPSWAFMRKRLYFDIEQNCEENAKDDDSAANEVLKQQLNERNAELDASQTRVKSLEESTRDLEKKLQNTEAQNQEITNKLRTLERTLERIRKLEEKLSNLQARTQDLEVKFHEKSESLKNGKIARLNNSILTKNNEIARLKHSLETKIIELQTERKMRWGIAERLGKKEEEAAKLSGENAVKKQELGGIQKKLEESENQAEAEKKRCQNMANEMNPKEK